MDINKELCEKLGICCPDISDYDDEGICGLCGECYEAHNIPDYVADPRLVLREMEKREDGKLFFAKLIYAGNNVEAIDDDGLIDRDLILDTTGRLAQIALDWIKEGK